ncbi:MAG: hypothetical protein WC529_01805 [Candidatus Margulisiibacteriota bacterium]
MRKIILTGGLLLLCLGLASPARAADKTLFITGTNITRASGNVTVGNDNIQFFKNGASLTLTIPGGSTPISDFAINAGAVETLGSPAGRNVQVDCVIGNSLSATVWTPAVGAGNYYGRTALSMSAANFDDSALTWSWNSLRVDYKADAPYKPAISRFEEATVYPTDGSGSTATLKVFAAGGNGADGLREVTGHAWKFWQPANPSSPAVDEPGATVTGAAGSTLQLSSAEVTAGKTYAFRVLDSNEWGSTWSDIYAHTLAGSAAGVTAGTVSFTYALKKSETGKLIVNSVTLPGLNLVKPTTATVAKASELVSLINSSAKSPIVIAISRWDTTLARAQGYAPIYDDKGAISGLTGEDFSLAAGEGYQLFVNQDLEVTFEGR